AATRSDPAARPAGCRRPRASRGTRCRRSHRTRERRFLRTRARCLSGACARRTGALPDHRCRRPGRNGACGVPCGAGGFHRPQGGSRMSLPAWLAGAWDALVGALDGGRVHHALLLAGPAGVGKRMLADAFIAAALCEQRSAGAVACGACRACVLLANGTHPDSLKITLEPRDDGKLRSELTIDQIRNLGQRLSLSSQFGGFQIARIDPADAMNANAANALLKTLEE